MMAAKTLRTRGLLTAFHHATAIAVAIKLANATGSKNFQPNDISWS